MFNERVGPVIEKEWANSVLSQRDNETDDDEPTRIPPVPIHFRNAALKRLLNAEPSVVHAEVDIWRKAHHGINNSVAEPADDDDMRFDAAERYHRYADRIQSHIHFTNTCR